MPTLSLPTSSLIAAVFAALLTTGCVSTAKDSPDTAQAEVNSNGQAAMLFNTRLQAVDGVQTTAVADNSVKVAFSGNTMFARDGTGLSASSQQQLLQVAVALKESNYSTALVLGHTDSSGQLAYNNTLSQQRADQVRAFLLQQGVSPEQLTAQGRGPAEPIADNNTAQGRAANRRVELIVVF